MRSPRSLPSPFRTRARAVSVVALVALGLGALGAIEARAEKPGQRGSARPYGKMVDVPGGRFSMGSADGGSDATPVHTEGVNPFKLDEIEVTVEAYAVCVKDGSCTKPVADRKKDCNWGVAGRARHPVNCVDVTQAQAFCRWSAKRLPTEAEWEFAARGGEAAHKYAWGDEAPGARACWDGAGNPAGLGKRSSTCEAAALAAGAFGLYDMTGNVWEWTASPGCPYAESGGYDLASCRDTSVRAFRGGSWNVKNADILLAAWRGYGVAGYQRADVGFRCAL